MSLIYLHFRIILVLLAGMKKEFSIDTALHKIDKAVRPFAKAAMFELAEEGFDSAFEQLVACIISIRTYDEAMLKIAHKFFARARTPLEVSRMSPEEIDEIISPSTFHTNKAFQIHEIARRIVAEYGGEMPCEEEVVLSFKGVGVKCANLVLGIACKQPRIGVDIHVHRVTNRWGYVKTPTPEKTTVALSKILPEKYWVEINRLLVPFGKHVCTGNLPKCSTCPVLEMCQQVGVSKHR